MTWHPGRCGIHAFLDVERARARTCDVCSGFLSETLDETALKRRPTEAQLAHSRKPAPPQTSRTISRMIRASMSEKNAKASAARAQELGLNLSRASEVGA